MKAQRIIALVGQRDQPTDGVADYCAWLGEAMKPLGCDLQTIRVRWPEIGWGPALSELKEMSREWKDSWAFLQYTGMAWSRRGFPARAPGIISTLKKNGVRCGVVFHDYHPFPGNRIIDRIRRQYQLHILSRLHRLADLSIFTAPLNKVSWLRSDVHKSAFVPVGANCPEPVQHPLKSDGPLTVAVYCVTAGPRMEQEVHNIGYALKRAATSVGELRLAVFGRGSEEAASLFKSEFSGTNIGVQVLGLLVPESVTNTLVGADVLLFVRGEISTRRGSAIAGIACGLPIVGFESVDLAWPMTEAGLLLVPPDDLNALSSALTKVLSDAPLRQVLQERSRRAQENYFSWPAIARQFLSAIDRPGESPTNEIAEIESVARKA